MWDEILAAAVIGTEQRELTLRGQDDQLGRLLARIDNADRERSLMSAAALVALYRGAGLIPPVDTQPLPEACDKEELTRASALSGQHLEMMLEGEFRELLPEWLTAITTARKRVPEEHLPALLDHGLAHPSLRGTIMSVLGKRGEWLAAQNPDWLYATGREVKEVWETESREERLLLLLDLRTVDPAGARELLATTWQQESAKDRAAFLETLTRALNPEDEPLLNEALVDRSVEVRRVARALLAGLPASEFSRRMKDLATQVLSFKQPLLGKTRIEVALPDDPIAWLKTHAIEIDNPPRNAAQSLGPKGWSLREMISLVRIDHWSAVWKKSPAEIVRAADASEWAEALIGGFLRAAQRDLDPEWITALVVSPSIHLRHYSVTELAAHLPAPRLEALILNTLKSQSTPLADAHPELPLLLLHRSAWSDQLSRAVVNSVRERINSDKTDVSDWQTRAALKQFARFVSPALYDELSSGWPNEAESWSKWSKNVDAFQSLLAFRRDMHKAISEKEQNL